MIGILEFAEAHLGRYVTAPGGIGGQCVDLANLWLVARGQQPVRANAADWPAVKIPGWAWVDNGPLNAPSPGDVVVWRRDVPALAIGPNGHIAVALTADAMRNVTLDQDWPPRSPVALVLHDYVGVAGWFTPEHTRANRA